MQPEIDFPSDLRALEHEYELIREIGQGGMAAVYLARHRSTGRLVAIKAIRARYLDDPDALERFAREARTVADLDHPNIVRTEAIEQIGDRAVAIIMEYVPGGTVRDRLHEYGPIQRGATPRAVLEGRRERARVCASARDRAPRRQAGKHLPRRADGPRTARRTSGSRVGSEGDGADHAPWRGDRNAAVHVARADRRPSGIDGRSDLYSLGLVGWEMLTGRRPWEGERLYSIIYKQKHEELPRITSLRPRVPANLLFAIEGALVKDREKRWQSIDEFAGAPHVRSAPGPLPGVPGRRDALGCRSDPTFSSARSELARGR